MKCEKKSYTKKQAQTVANHRMKRGKGRNNRGRPEYLRVYPCPCGSWHLTHKINKPKKYG